MRKWVYGFEEVQDAAERTGSWEAVRTLLGGKGANLGDMTRLGVPVPPGFTVSTEACLAYLAEQEHLPDDMWEQELAALRDVEVKTGKRFGEAAQPLLVSCRSGAKFSMPGMMDTILNIGLNDEVAAGLVGRTSDPRFVYDSYRRLVQMFGTVVLGVSDEIFEAVIADRRQRVKVSGDAELSADDWSEVTRAFKGIVRRHTGEDFPEKPLEQLRMATEAVFRSWNSRRAVDYRNAAGISHDLGTAVNIQAMVFGNMGEDCATGVVMSRNPTTGEPGLDGDYMVNTQGEDVVAGIRATQVVAEMAQAMPETYRELTDIGKRLERRYRNMQDIEFTIEKGKLWILQTRDGKRTAQAEVRIVVDMVEEGLIDRETAVTRVKPEQVDVFLHPQFVKDGLAQAVPLATGLNVSPGAAVGAVAFDADTAERWAKKEQRNVIMVRPETKPDDVHGMLAAEGVLTSSGGRTSHAALVARQFGKPAVVGAAELDIDLEGRIMTVGETIIDEGTVISIDGTTGQVFLGEIPTVIPDIESPCLSKVLAWADEIRTLGVRGNADYPSDAERARKYGAEGLGLVRTEHMFFETERLPLVQEMILARTRSDRAQALAQLLPMQRSDFMGLFRVMEGLPVIIRLIDPPLHEFLPSHDDLVRELADLKVQLQHFRTMQEIDVALLELRKKQDQLERVAELREQNPMLGTRGVRLGILMPELIRMQVRAIFEAACTLARQGIDVHPEVMIPLTAHVNELKLQRQALDEEAGTVMEEQGMRISYRFGTMIEVPRAALAAGELAEVAEFFSYGTNDLTQTTFGISRDDAERGFLLRYLEDGVLEANPFTSIDEKGVGKLLELGTELGRETRPGLEVGICGEHGGDPRTIHFCHRVGLDYVSCSPFRVPIARLAAAQAVLETRGEEQGVLGHPSGGPEEWDAEVDLPVSRDEEEIPV